MLVIINHFTGYMVFVDVFLSFSNNEHIIWFYFTVIFNLSIQSLMIFSTLMYKSFRRLCVFWFCIHSLFCWVQDISKPFYKPIVLISSLFVCWRLLRREISWSFLGPIFFKSSWNNCLTPVSLIFITLLFYFIYIYFIFCC